VNASMDSSRSESFTNSLSQSSKALERLTRSNFPYVQSLRNDIRRCGGVQTSGASLDAKNEHAGPDACECERIASVEVL
jgi:hypothetical protein